MRQNMEELQTTQEELERKVTDYESQIIDKELLIRKLATQQPEVNM
jgi:hypothetical protein